MWLFLPCGFYSVVTDRNDPERRLVRARRKAALVSLGRGLPFAKPFIHHTPSADYPYRINVHHGLLQAIVKHHLESMTYTNFKGAVLKGPYLEKLHEVWALMRQLEDPKAHKPPRARRPRAKPPTGA